jgi:hypothetical protein
MGATTMIDDHLITGFAAAVNDVAAFAGIRVTKADHEFTGFVHVVEHDAGRCVGVRERTGSMIGVGASVAWHCRKSQSHTETKRRDAPARE